MFRPRRRPSSRFASKPGVCPFCNDKSMKIDYKDPGRLRTFISDQAKIEPRRRSNACAKHQRRLSLAIKRARYLALLPYTPRHMEKSGFMPRERTRSA